MSTPVKLKKVVLTQFGLHTLFQVATARFDSREKPELWGDEDYECSSELQAMLIPHAERRAATAAVKAFIKRCEERVMTRQQVDAVVGAANDAGVPADTLKTLADWSVGTKRLEPESEEFYAAIEELDRGDYVVKLLPNVCDWAQKRLKLQQHMGPWAPARAKLVRALKNALDVVEQVD